MEFSGVLCPRITARGPWRGTPAVVENEMADKIPTHASLLQLGCVSHCTINDFKVCATSTDFFFAGGGNLLLILTTIFEHRVNDFNVFKLTVLLTIYKVFRPQSRRCAN